MRFYGAFLYEHLFRDLFYADAFNEIVEHFLFRIGQRADRRFPELHVRRVVRPVVFALHGLVHHLEKLRRTEILEPKAEEATEAAAEEATEVVEEAAEEAVTEAATEAE